MDKNNDIKTSNVSKWEAAPKNMGTLFTYIDLVIGTARSLPSEIRDNLYDLMDKTFDEYNKLEATYEEAYDTIYRYEEETHDLEKELRIREKEKDEKDKLIDELNSKIKELKLRMSMMHSCYGLNSLDELNRKNEALKKENEELKAKNRSLQLRMNVAYGSYKSTHNALKKMVNKVTEFERENKELKDTIEKDGEFGKNVGKRVADSIREGCDKGVYELHPYTRIDIHVEETNNMPTTFDRHAIPRIAVMFNNTQTEMERDTAQHECEELDKKVDRLWSVNEELNRKIKGLEKDNKDLKTILAMCNRDADMARSLCEGLAFHTGHARNDLLSKEEN